MSNLLDAINKNSKKEETQNIETIHMPPVIENIIQKYKKPSLNNVIDKVNQPQEQNFPSCDNSIDYKISNKNLHVDKEQKIKNVSKSKNKKLNDIIPIKKKSKSPTKIQK